jgi:hypothetical protein
MQLIAHACVRACVAQIMSVYREAYAEAEGRLLSAKRIDQVPVRQPPHLLLTPSSPLTLTHRALCGLDQQRGLDMTEHVQHEGGDIRYLGSPHHQTNTPYSPYCMALHPWLPVATQGHGADAKRGGVGCGIGGWGMMIQHEAAGDATAAGGAE